MYRLLHEIQKTIANKKRVPEKDKTGKKRPKDKEKLKDLRGALKVYQVEATVKEETEE